MVTKNAQALLVRNYVRAMSGCVVFLVFKISNASLTIAISPNQYINTYIGNTVTLPRKSVRSTFFS